MPEIRNQDKRLGLTSNVLNLGLNTRIISCGLFVSYGLEPHKPAMPVAWTYGDLTIMLYGDGTEMITYA